MRKQIYIVILMINIMSACTQKDSLKDSQSKTTPKGRLPEATATHWIDRHQDKLLDYDREKNIFQIRVLRQIKSECSSHQERNLLYMLDMLDNEPEEFNKKYEKMISEDEYEKLMNVVTCQIAFGGSRISPEISKLIDENPNYASYLPAKSKEYLSMLIPLEHITNGKYSEYEDKNVKKYWKCLKDKIATAEQDHPPTEQELDDAARLFYPSNIIQKINTIFGNYDDITIPLSLGINSIGNIEHSVGLIARRKQGKWEYIFMDPLNWQFSKTETYKKTLNALLRFFSDKDYALKSILRNQFANIFCGTLSGEVTKKSEFNCYTKIPIHRARRLSPTVDGLFERVYKKPLEEACPAEMNR